MKIIIRETNAAEELSIIDPDNGVDYIADFIGNTGALMDGQFEWDEELDAQVCDQATFDWWDTVVDDNQELTDRIHEMLKIYDQDAVYKVIGENSNVDLEDHASVINAALDEFEAQTKAEEFISQARSGDSPEISSGVWLCLGSDLNAIRDLDDESPLLIPDQLYIHTNDGVLYAADIEDVLNTIKN